MPIASTSMLEVADDSEPRQSAVAPVPSVAPPLPADAELAHGDALDRDQRADPE